MHGQLIFTLGTEKTARPLCLGAERRDVTNCPIATKLSRAKPSKALPQALVESASAEHQEIVVPGVTADTSSSITAERVCEVRRLQPVRTLSTINPRTPATK